MKNKNRKTPVVFRVGVSLIFAVFFSMFLMGNLYMAKYGTTVNGTSSAQVAKIDCKVYQGQNFNPTLVSNLTLRGDSSDIYAVVLTVTVENTGDVSYGYELALDVKPLDESGDPNNRITLGAPTGTNAVKYISDAAISVGGSGAFTTGNAYFATVIGSGDAVWSTKAIDASDKLVISHANLGIGEKHSYQVVCFIDCRYLDVSLLEDIKIDYDITCTQID